MHKRIGRFFSDITEAGIIKSLQKYSSSILANSLIYFYTIAAKFKIQTEFDLITRVQTTKVIQSHFTS